MNTKMKTIGLFAIALLALTALVGSAQALPDLTVSNVSVNPGNTRGEEIVRVYVNDNNKISADVCNIGDVAAIGPFDVCFDDGTEIGCVEVTTYLDAGASTTVSIEWTPTCANYSVMPGFPAQSLPITINVTADCNSAVDESDETNNTLSKYVSDIQKWDYKGTLYDVKAGVINNGYRSKNFDCDPAEEPLTVFEYDEICGCGGIAYNVSGDKTHLWLDPSTRVHHIDIPVDATVKKARLYVYWYDYWGNFRTYDPDGCIADLSVTFNGTTDLPTTVPSAAEYIDQKGFGAWQSSKGTYAYDVTSLVSGSGDYTAVISNNVLPKTTLLGELLYVVYDFEGAPCGKTIQLWTLEGNDYLMAADETHNKYNYSVSPEEATATVAFPGSIDLPNVGSATLVTVVTQGMKPGSNMLFNGNVIKADAWDADSEAGPKSTSTPKYSGSRINVESVDVTSNLTASGNNMGFEDTGTDGMQASNAFLIVELTTIPANVTIEPETLNLKSNGEWVTAYIELPGYDVADINCSTILLDCKIPADSCDRPNESVIGDHDMDDIPDLMVKFNRDAVITYLGTYDFDGDTGNHKVADLSVTGQVAGTPFEGSDTVRVLQ